VSPSDADAVIAFCREHGVEFVVVGPEDPLASGIADALVAAGIACFGPGKQAARLEADKAFAKEVMRDANVPTAESRTFYTHAEADRFVKRREAPMVVKAAGLAKGKGVVVCDTNDEAVEAVRQAMKLQAFGDAGKTVVVEDKLEGVECSVLALVDHGDIFVLPPCQDHKPVGEGNTGPMTGGMGAYCPSTTLSAADLAAVEQNVIIPTLDRLAGEGIRYRGCLYVGLMLTPDGPRVLEFNVRFGDPETQPLMLRWQGDLLAALHATATGKLAAFVESGGIAFDDRASVCVVLASGGYPGSYENGREITGTSGLDSDDLVVFHAGTKQNRDALVTAGGRVLGATALGDDLAAAREKAYAAAEAIDFDGVHFRRDIGGGGSTE
ncbi:MAG: phosphoribosylamine--glycine ligase, partial [Planctomycetota bacterium]